VSETPEEINMAMQSTGFIRAYAKSFDLAREQEIIAVLRSISIAVPENEFRDALRGAGPILEVESTGQPDIIPFVNAWLPFRETLSSLGVTISEVHIHYDYHLQCALGLSVDELALLASNNLNLLIDCRQLRPKRNAPPPGG
jgi:hypothetical protein